MLALLWWTGLHINMDSQTGDVIHGKGSTREANDGPN